MAACWPRARRPRSARTRAWPRSTWGPTMLAVRDVHAGYGDSMILQGVSLQVGQGQVATVLGRNGGGKPPLIRAISGLIPVRRGAVMLNGDALPGSTAL